MNNINPSLHSEFYLNLVSQLQEKTDFDFHLKEIGGVIAYGNLFHFESPLGNSSFVLEHSALKEQLKNVYFIKNDNQLIKKTLIDSIILISTHKSENIGILDGTKIPLRILSLNQRTYRAMCTGYMNNKIFETVEDVLGTTQKNISSTQLQLGKNGLNDLSETITRLGYTLN